MRTWNDWTTRSMVRPTSTRSGAVAYWLLTGKKFFSCINAMQMVIDHARTAPVPVSQRAPA